MKRKSEFLTECEEKVMMVIWDSDEKLSLLPITEQVNQRFNESWAQQTVSTFLRRLEQKK